MRQAARWEACATPGENAAVKGEEDQETTEKN
jgi:hypothetical protein